MTDSVHEVVVEALGALRNLTVVGGEEVINEMYAKNVLTPVTALIPPLGTMIDSMLSGPASTSEEHDKRKTVWDWADNVISIVWAMSEHSEKALKTINKINLIPFLMSFMNNVDKVPPKVIVSAGKEKASFSLCNAGHEHKCNHKRKGACYSRNILSISFV